MPTFWQWFFAIIGLVAFLMAMPYILQLLFGQPRIGVTFSHDDSGNEGRVINIHLMNSPINNRLLKALRVSRLSAQDVFLSVKVYNALTKQVVADSFAPEIETFQSNKAIRASLPPSILLANITLAQWQRSTDSAVLFIGSQLIPLKEGTYIFLIQVGLDGETKRFKSFLLHIGKTENEMVWDKKMTDKIFM